MCASIPENPTVTCACYVRKGSLWGLREKKEFSSLLSSNVVYTHMRAGMACISFRHVAGPVMYRFSRSDTHTHTRTHTHTSVSLRSPFLLFLLLPILSLPRGVTISVQSGSSKYSTFIKKIESFRGGGEGGGGGDAAGNDGSGEGGECKGEPKDGRSIDPRRSTQAIALEVLARLETLAQRQAQLAEEQRTVATEQAQLNRVLSDLMQPSKSR